VCGICGFTGAPDRDLLRSMTRSLTHRGPDDSGFFEDSRLSIGVQRLSIIDIAGGHQPLCNEDESVWLVYNGEIYNFRSLRDDLSHRGHRFATATDSETVVHAYEEHGLGFVNYLSGMFAFALWDQRRQRLVLARDRIGMKPLYYAPCNDGVVFASEIKAMLLHPYVTRKPNHDVLRLILSFGYSPDNRTPFREVFKLPPGHVLTWENGEYSLREFWRIPNPREFEKSDQKVIKTIRLLLDRAVASHLVSDVPIGLMLSGGLDSSIVAALTKKLARDTLKTFTFVYAEQPETADRTYAAEVARYLDTEHREIVIDGDDMLNLLPSVVYYHDEPKVDAASFPTLATARELRKQVTVVLVGEGSDEQFGGYYSHSRFATTRMVRGLVPKFTGKDWFLDLVDAMPSLRRHMRALEYIGALDNANLALRIMNSPVVSEWEYAHAADPEFRLRTEDVDPGAVYTAVFAESGARDSTIPSQVDLRVYIPNDISMKIDKMTMAASVEARMPFLDGAILEYTPTIDPHLKTKGGVSKYLLRRAFSDVLPRAVLRRAKQTIQVPVARWIGNHIEPFEQLALGSIEAKRCPVSRSACSRIAARARSGHDLRASIQLLALSVLETWYRIYIDPETWKAAIPSSVMQEWGL